MKMRIPGRSTRRAFTLIELLIVIAIILLLLAMILPHYRPIADMIRRARCQVQLRGLGQAYLLYTFEHHRFPPIWSRIEYNFDTGAYAGWYYPQNCYQCCVYGRFEGGFGPLIWHGIVNNADVFLCPVVKDSDFPWWHDGPIPPPKGWSETAESEDLEDLGYYWSGRFENREPVRLREQLAKGEISNAGRQFTRSCYNVRPYLYPWSPGQVENRDRAPGQQQSKGVRAIMADNCSVPVMVLERHGDGVNVFYIDGSVLYVTHPILWDNSLTWGYIQNTPVTGQIWKALDEYK